MQKQRQKVEEENLMCVSISDRTLRTCACYEARRDPGPEPRTHWRFNSEGILVNKAMQ